MLDNIGVIIGIIVSAAVSLSGIITSVYLFRQLKRAEVRLKEYEVKSKEISTADEMIQLVKTAYAEVEQIKQDIVEASKEIAETNKKENEKLRKLVARFEKAVKAIGSCPYSDNCPVADRLRCEKETDDNGDQGPDRTDHRPRDAPGHSGHGGGRQQHDPGADRVRQPGKSNP